MKAHVMIAVPVATRDRFTELKRLQAAHQNADITHGSFLEYLLDLHEQNQTEQP